MSVRLCKTSGSRYYLVVETEVHISKATAVPSTFVFTIDMSSGTFFYTGTPNIDLFDSPEAARDYIQSIAANLSWEELGIALVGATRHHGRLVICSVKRDETVAYVFGKPVNKILEVGFKEIVFDATQVPETGDWWKDFPLPENHFYCRGKDLSDKFPYSSETVAANSSPFCWNKRWIASFRGLQANDVCIVVLQGMALSWYKEPDARTNITYILKRSAANPGTRFNARGVNSTGDPANECECELIFTNGDETTACAWRRGSIPLRWKTTIFSPASQVKNTLEAEATRDTSGYFCQLGARFDLRDIVVVSLLYDDPKKGESGLTEAYSNAVHEIAEVNVKFHSFDLNTIIKEGSGEKKSEKAMRLMLSELDPDIRDSKFTVVNGDGVITENQNILARFNCADSLDRTNLATFYYALWVTSRYSQMSHLFANESGGLAQEVVDFVGTCLLEGGKVVSLLYTNTHALKAACIAEFMSEGEKPQMKSDTMISAQRRFFNTFKDEQRQKVLEQWTHTKRTSWPSHLLASQFLAACPSWSGKAIGHQMVDENVQGFWIYPGMNNESVFMLPEPLVVSAINLVVVPHSPIHAVRVTISTGTEKSQMFPIFKDLALPNVSEAQWVRYDLQMLNERSNEVPFDGRSAGAANFVSIKFESSDPEQCFLVGNLRLEVKRPSLGGTISVVPVECAEDPFDQFAPSEAAPTTVQLLAIELAMITQGIPPAVKNHLLVSHGISPFLFDLSGRLSQIVPNKCPLCGRPLPRTPQCFVRNEQYQAFLLRSKQANPESAIQLCNNCAQEMDMDKGAPRFAKIVEEAKKNGTVASVDRGRDIPRKHPRYYSAGDISLLPFCFLWDYTQGAINRQSLLRLLVPDGQIPKPLSIDSSDDVTFTFCFTGIVKISVLELELAEDADVSCRVSSAIDSWMELQRQGRKFSVTIENDTEWLKFVWHGTAGVHCSLKAINLKGHFCRERPSPAPAPSKFLTWNVNPREVQTKWSLEQRKQTLLNITTPISTIILRVSQDKNNPCSLILACYHDGKCIYDLPIIIPEVREEGFLAYPIENVTDWESTTITLFYLDRNPKFQPYKVFVPAD